MAVTQYIGSRYVPLFADPIEWSSANTYEPLTIVIHEGNSYTSRQAVPKGIDIDNESFWALTGNYNAQVELYRRETAAAKAAADGAQADATAAQTDIDVLLPKNEFSSQLTVKDYIDNKGAKYITLSELATAGDGIFTLGRVTVNNPINFPRTQNRNMIIVDTIFDIATNVMFPPYGGSSYFVLPTFVGCTFRNATNGRVLLAKGDLNIVGSKFTGCNFIDVDVVSATYCQDYDFTGCYIQSSSSFLESENGTVQARFVNCSVESESKKIVQSKQAVIYVNGVFEGNEQTDWHFFNFAYGVMKIDGAWIEGANFAKIAGGNTNLQRTIVVISGSKLVASKKPIFAFENATYVYMYILGSLWVPHDQASLICTNTPDEFASILGYFIHMGSETFNKPFGGVIALNKELASKDDVSKAISEIQNQYTSINLATTPIDITLPCGIWRVTITRYTAAALYVTEHIVYASIPYSTETSVTETLQTQDVYLQSVSIQASKSATTDTTFSMHIEATKGATYYISISKA